MVVYSVGAGGGGSVVWWGGASAKLRQDIAMELACEDDVNNCVWCWSNVIL